MCLSNEEMNVHKMAKKYGIDDSQNLFDLIDALSYLILHLAKLNATEEDFANMFE